MKKLIWLVVFVCSMWFTAAANAQSYDFQSVVPNYGSISVDANCPIGGPYAWTGYLTVSVTDSLGRIAIHVEYEIEDQTESVDDFSSHQGHHVSANQDLAYSTLYVTGLPEDVYTVTVTWAGPGDLSLNDVHVSF
jgi:hypothetical protein